MVDLRQRKKEKTRQIILGAAHELALEHGFASTTMEQIARAAGVSKPIVYEHFGGKEGLYAVVVDREMESLYNRMLQGIFKSFHHFRFGRGPGFLLIQHLS